jgi:hypothetical protein
MIVGASILALAARGRGNQVNPVSEADAPANGDMTVIDNKFGLAFPR